MPQSIHWYVRKMPQLKIWSMKSVKITILRFCMDCRSQGRQSGTPPEQKPFFRTNLIYFGKYTWYWGGRVGLSVGIATLNRRPLGMQMHSWNWPTSPWRKVYDENFRIRITDRVAAASMGQHDRVEDDPSRQFHRSLLALQADVRCWGQRDRLASNLNKHTL